MKKPTVRLDKYKFAWVKTEYGTLCINFSHKANDCYITSRRFLFEDIPLTVHEVFLRNADGKFVPIYGQHALDYLRVKDAKADCMELAANISLRVDKLRRLLGKCADLAYLTRFPSGKDGFDVLKQNTKIFRINPNGSLGRIAPKSESPYFREEDP